MELCLLSISNWLVMPNDHTCIATPIIGGPSEPMLSCSGTSGPCKCQSLVEVPKSSLLQKTRQRLVVDAQGIYIYIYIHLLYTHIYIYIHTSLCKEFALVHPDSDWVRPDHQAFIDVLSQVDAKKARRVVVRVGWVGCTLGATVVEKGWMTIFYDTGWCTLSFSRLFIH